LSEQAGIVAGAAPIEEAAPARAAVTFLDGTSSRRRDVTLKLADVCEILDGETVVGVKPVMGYLHRSTEKLGEARTYVQGTVLTDRMDYLSAITAVDWRDRVEMLYHCYGWDYVETPGCLVIRADLPPEPNPLCPSLTAVWTGAELQEREIYDLFGVKFIGHPDLRRILLDDNFPGHPLRKDWTFDYEYVLVKHLKYGAEGQDAPPGGEEGFRRV